MSRKGKLPISISDNVTTTLENSIFTVKGPKGELTLSIRSDFSVETVDSQLHVKNNSSRRDANAMYGLYRSLVANMVEGVTNGFSKRIELFGVGYRAIMKGSDIELSIGFSHPVHITPLDGNTLSVEGQTTIIVSGSDKCKVGDQVASIIKIRDARKDPYKNKGIRLEGARLRKKSGKKVG